jgi:uncharacterized protein
VTFAVRRVFPTLVDCVPIFDQLKQGLFRAMKSGQTVEKEVLRTVIGEATSTGLEPTDEHLQKVIRKLIKSNRETLAAQPAAEQVAVLEQEISVLEQFLPRNLAGAELEAVLEPHAAELKASANEGPALGVALKLLKARGLTVESAEVGRVVRLLRSR